MWFWELSRFLKLWAAVWNVPGHKVHLTLLFLPSWNRMGWGFFERLLDIPPA